MTTKINVSSVQTRPKVTFIMDSEKTDFSINNPDFLKTVLETRPPCSAESEVRDGVSEC